MGIKVTFKAPITFGLSTTSIVANLGACMDDPLMLTAATTLVAWATTNLADGARSAVAGLTEFIRHRFGREMASRETVESPCAGPAPTLFIDSRHFWTGDPP